MSERIKWIEYKGKKVLKVDYTGLRGDALLNEILRVPSFYEGQVHGSVLVLTDVRSAHADEKTMAAINSTSNREAIHDSSMSLTGPK